MRLSFTGRNGKLHVYVSPTKQSESLEILQRKIKDYQVGQLSKAQIHYRNQK